MLEGNYNSKQRKTKKKKKKSPTALVDKENLPQTITTRLIRNTLRKKEGKVRLLTTKQ